MKRSNYLYTILTLIFLCSCGENKENTQFPENSFYPENNIENQETIPEQRAPDKQNSAQPSIKPHYIINQQFGMPVGAMPIPSTWNKKEANAENIYFEGPNGIKVYSEFSQNYSFNNDPQRNQYTIQAGGKVQPVKSLQNLIEQELKPYAETQGMRFKNQFPLPQLALFDKQFDSYLFKATPEQRHTDCVVTEWENADGNLAVIIVRYNVVQYTQIGGVDWGYTLNRLVAPKSEYENAKYAYINALVNFQINPKWVQTNNQYYAQMAQQNNAGHQARMANIQAQGQQILADGRARSQAMDDQFNNWRSGQADSDKNQAKFIDGIYERRNMTDQSGNLYKIEGYENKVWMNNNNEYIATDNSLYNPNANAPTNDYNWQELEETDNGY